MTLELVKKTEICQKIEDVCITWTDGGLNKHQG